MPPGKLGGVESVRVPACASANEDPGLYRTDSSTALNCSPVRTVVATNFNCSF